MRPDEHADTLAAGDAGSAPHQKIGTRYEILGLLGAGGMGNVYKARDLELDELVALKVLRPELVGAPGALERFKREVKLARRVTHPNVARVFDLGEHGGDRVLTMELVDGEALSALLAREVRLPLARAVEVGRAICAGVGAAHAAGVVHRDLKPDNVLVAKDGRIVVTDFGIARAAAEGARTVGFVGTPAYMAPEQIDERATIDHRADVYAFGALLFELVTGEPAWTGESIWALASARLLQPPPDPRSRRPDLPAALASLVLRCMAREQAERFSSMDEVSAALAAVALPQSTTPVPAARREDGLDDDRSGKRVAVLPLSNLGPPEQEYVADGLTEDLIDLLSVAQGLHVRSRGMVMRFKGSTRDPREVGRDLDVQAVVEGSVRKGPGGFRVNVRVVSVTDGLQLWARRFDVPEAELLAQNEVIARAVAEALSVDLARPKREAAKTATAVDLYLRARAAYHGAFTGDHTAAVALFDEVLALAPDDPLFVAARAMAGARSFAWSDADRAKTRAFADRALELAPTLPEAHAARGLLANQDCEPLVAIASLRRAILLAPNNADAHDGLGRILAEADADAGRRHLETAVTLDPTLEYPRINLARHFFLRGQPEAADEACTMMVDGAPRRMLPVVARFVLWSRDAERAKRELEGLVPTSVTLRTAKDWLELVAYGRPPPLPPPSTPLPPAQRRFFGGMAVEYAGFRGDLTAGLEALRRCDADGDWDLEWLERCPLLDGLRALPEVQPIRERYRGRASAIVAAYEAPLA